MVMLSHTARSPRFVVVEWAGRLREPSSRRDAFRVSSRRRHTRARVSSSSSTNPPAARLSSAAPPSRAAASDATGRPNLVRYSSPSRASSMTRAPSADPTVRVSVSWFSCSRCSSATSMSGFSSHSAARPWPTASAIRDLTASIRPSRSSRSTHTWRIACCFMMGHRARMAARPRVCLAAVTADCVLRGRGTASEEPTWRPSASASRGLAATDMAATERELASLPIAPRGALRLRENEYPLRVDIRRH
mmetsp:Transcript_16136/g.61097  ORF Transcript_16136/g.61097 Transcript_16136/m.61097 type:complete len:248 (+) Transcript_16136:328-1071(+)